MRKKYLHAPKGNGAINLYLDSLDAYKNAFLTNHDELKSWRKVAEPYKIYPSMARMIANGHSPGNKIRSKLGLPPMDKVPVCRTCGIVHTTKRCIGTNHRPRPPRIAIRLDNPESAVRSIKGHMDSEVIAELIEILQEANDG